MPLSSQISGLTGRKKDTNDPLRSLFEQSPYADPVSDIPAQETKTTPVESIDPTIGLSGDTQGSFSPQRSAPANYDYGYLGEYGPPDSMGRDPTSFASHLANQFSDKKIGLSIGMGLIGKTTPIGFGLSLAGKAGIAGLQTLSDKMTRDKKDTHYGYYGELGDIETGYDTGFGTGKKSDFGSFGYSGGDVGADTGIGDQGKSDIGGDFGGYSGGDEGADVGWW